MARLPLVLADFTVIMVTWATQYRQHKMARSILRGSGLATVLLQNGEYMAYSFSRGRSLVAQGPYTSCEAQGSFEAMTCS